MSVELKIVFEMNLKYTFILMSDNAYEELYLSMVPAIASPKTAISINI